MRSDEVSGFLGDVRKTSPSAHAHLEAPRMWRRLCVAVGWVLHRARADTGPMAGDPLRDRWATKKSTAPQRTGEDLFVYPCNVINVM